MEVQITKDHIEGMRTFIGFLTVYYRHVQAGHTYTQAYEATEELWRIHWSPHVRRYKNIDSFRTVRDRHLQKMKQRQ